MTSADFHSRTLQVRTPATSANLGPGYDSFGLALSLFDELNVELARSGLDIVVSGEGAERVRKDEKNLVVKSMFRAFERMGVRPDGLVVHCRNCIPHGRGLGSSAAAIVGGIVAARGLVRHGNERLTDQQLLALATELEGHPDNAAAAIYGGFTISWSDGADVGTVSIPPHADVVPIAFVPDTELRTATARGVLPAEIPHGDAAANSARAALLVHAISREPSLLMAGTLDLLHQRYRRSVMPQSLELVDQLRAEGIPAVVSGAGPSVLALTRSDASEAVAGRTLDGWSVLVLSPESPGVRTQFLDDPERAQR